jgi:predicted AlkP superfamily pyrophosphatase or phosphodiesterase
MIRYAVGMLAIVGALLSPAWPVSAQAPGTRPRLVVVIAIDQLRPDYLQRFRRFFGPGGFNLMLTRGASFTQAYYEHGATLTCPGHAVMLTGSYPDVNGIVANAWFNLAQHKPEYCAADTMARLIGAGGEGRSPRNLLVSTVGDQLKQATGNRSRVIAIAGKDRSAIMLGGLRADAAYWTEDTLVVTSTYYMRELPSWVRRFNASGAITGYRGRTWDRLLPLAAYRIAGPDDVAAEENPGGMGRTFPHRLSSSRSPPGDFLTGFQTSPFENEVLVRLATEAVTQEQLGQDESPDILAIGFSANDLVGHSYGPESHEVMDMTVWTDRQLERLFGFLGRRIGLDNVLVVLTSDHGVAPLPEVARRGNPQLNAARIDPAVISAAAENALRARYGEPRGPAWMTQPNWIMYQGLPWLFLNLPALEDKQVAVAEAEQVAQAAVSSVRGVAQVHTATELRRGPGRGPRSSAERGFHPERSGQLYVVLAPYLVPGSGEQGTTHGSPWAYDTHVPLLWLGPGIKSGSYSGPVGIADLAPTLSALLEIESPPSAQGRILRELFSQPVDSTTTAMP